MNLTQYIKNFKRSERMEARNNIAKGLKITEVFVRSMCNGNKAIPVKHAIKIEKLTNGAVPRHVTAPDLYPLE